MESEVSTSSDLLVACLCADWCYVCGDYRAVFESLRDEIGAHATFVWIDIEDDEAALGNIDVDDFPTFLIARGKDVVHFGPLMPRREAVLRTVQRALSGESSVVADARLEDLALRVRALANTKQP
jgi:thioredoxin 1